MTAPVFEIAGLAYRDSIRAPLAFPALAAVTLMVSMAQTFLAAIIQYDSVWLDMTIGLVLGSIAAFLMTPYLIAVHRYILLGEVTKTFDVRSRRFQQFFAYSVVLLLFMECLSIGMIVFGPRSTAGFVLTIAVLIAFTVVSVRVILLFPAVAVDSGKPDWRSAMRASRGHFWRISFVCLLVLAPEVVLLDVIVLRGVAVGGAENLPQFSTGATLLMGLGNFYSRSVLVAAASHLYRHLGDRMSDGL